MRNTHLVTIDFIQNTQYASCNIDFIQNTQYASFYNIFSLTPKWVGCGICGVRICQQCELKSCAHRQFPLCITILLYQYHQDYGALMPFWNLGSLGKKCTTIQLCNFWGWTRPNLSQSFNNKNFTSYTQCQQNVVI